MQNNFGAVKLFVSLLLAFKGDFYKLYFSLLRLRVRKTATIGEQFTKNKFKKIIIKKKR